MTSGLQIFFKEIWKLSWTQAGMLHRLRDDDLMSRQGPKLASCHYMILAGIHVHIIIFLTRTQPLHFHSILCDCLKFIGYY